MSHPIPTAPAAQFRDLLRSFALDPGPLTAHLLAAGHLARVVAQETGKTRDRIFTPMVTTAAFLGQVLSDDHSCQAAVAPPDRLACRPGAAPMLGRHRRLLQGPPAAPRDAPAPAGPRRRRPARRGGPRRLAVPRPTRRPRRRLVGQHARHPGQSAPYPQPRQQKAGCGFPVARVVVLIALATGCVLDAALCGGRGKLTGEHALLRGLHGRLRSGATSWWPTPTTAPTTRSCCCGDSAWTW